jgi:two-component system chemotaxis response regulator CheY
MKVLVVDDSSIMRRVIEQILRGLGHVAVQAGDGREALARLAEHRDVGLILLDWNMPRMSGLELLHALRADAEARQVPVIVLTTEAERRKMIQAIEAGARLYMTKPFAAETLAAKIEQCLAVA